MIYRYDEKVSFDLPKKYKFLDTINDKGERSVQIGLNPHKEDGEEQYDSMFNISIASSDDGNSIIDNAEKNNKEAKLKKRYNSNPPALFILSENESSIFGVPFILRIFGLFVEIDKENAVSIMMLSSSTDPDNDDTSEKIEQVHELWSHLKIKGKAVTTGDTNIQELEKENKRKNNLANERNVVLVNSQISVKERTLTVGNRWKAVLPLGWRIKEQEGAENINHWSIFVDYRPLGYLAAGDTIGTHKQAVQALDTVFAESILGAGKLVDNVVIRDDNLFNVSVTVYLKGDGKSIAEIDIIEKTFHNLESKIYFVLTSSIDDLDERLSKIREREIGIEPYLGFEWETNWQAVVMLAASISQIDEETSPIKLGEKKELLAGFVGAVPEKMKFLKGTNEGADLYYETTAKPSKSDYNKKDHDYVIVSKPHLSDNSDDEDDEDEKHSTLAKAFSKAVLQGIESPFAEPVYERMLATGYVGVYICFLNENTSVAVTAMNKNMDSVTLALISENGKKTVAERVQIATEIAKSIEIDHETDEVFGKPFPALSDLLHEHYDLVESGNYTTRRDADFIGQSIRDLMRKHQSTRKQAYKMMTIDHDDYDLDKLARSLAKVFRLDSFDPYHDTEALIRIGAFENVGSFHALRSLAWTLNEMAFRQGRSLSDYSYDELLKAGDQIQESNYLNYVENSYSPGLCNHYDWHVFYVPDEFIGSDCSNETDLRYLCGKENRGGNSTTIVFGGFGFGQMNRTSDIIGRNEETLESLEALRKDLRDLAPVMITIYNGLMIDRDRSEKLAGPLPDALIAWCALCIAAVEPFYSEEATDTPEADAGISEPLTQPNDVIEDDISKFGIQSKPVIKTSKKTTKATKKETKPKTSSNKQDGEVLDLGGKTVIEPGQFSGNMTLRKIIIPEGVTEIGNNAFNSCMFLESVKLPSTIKKIDDMAFMSCRALRSINLPEGLEEIGNHAFGATNSLTEVHLPDSLVTVHRLLFGMGGDSPYATAYMSGKLAKKLQDTHVKNGGWSRSSAISARRFVIDGKGYEDLLDYYRAESPRESIPSTPARTMSPEELDALLYSPDTNKEYEKYIAKSPQVVIQGKKFVFTGFGVHGDLDSLPLAKNVEKKGGLLRKSISGITDYLVIKDLPHAGTSKLREAVAQMNAGKPIQIITEEDLNNALSGKTKAGINKSSTTSSTSKPPRASSSTSSKSAAKKKMAEQTNQLESIISSTSAELGALSTGGMDDEQKAALKEAQGILENMQSDMDSTKSALEKHAENLRKQEEEKEKRMAEAKAKGKSDKDEADMLAVLLIEEDQGNLYRTDDDFAETFAEDFAAYDSKQLIKLRQKVRPKMHDSSFQASAKEVLLSKPVKDRFSISTANWFNLSNLWDFNEKGALAIEKTKQYYRDSELNEVRDLMNKHKQAGIDSVNNQLTSFNSTWNSFSGVRNDLHICIGSCDEPIPDSRKVFDVMIDGTNHVYIQLQHPSMGFLTIPIMNLFASVWKTTPEKIWDAALSNEINDSRGVYGRSRSDAISAKAKALAAIKSQNPQPKQMTTTQVRTPQISQPMANSKPATASSHNESRIREIQGKIASLNRELTSVKGILGFFKRNKLKKEINDLENELSVLRK